MVSGEILAVAKMASMSMCQRRCRAVVAAAVQVLELQASAQARALRCVARRAGMARGLCRGAHGDT
jgi:hypothetical protein